MTLAADDISRAIEAGAPVQVPAQDPADDKRHGPSQATIMVGLALQAGAELFHTPEGVSYATLAIDGHKETWRLRSQGVKTWLGGIFYRAEGKAAGGQAVSDALGALDAMAIYDGPELPVYTRIAEHDGMIYLDLADDGWRSIEIAPGGWRVCTDAPVRFVRPRGMLALPEPTRDGTLAALRALVNVPSDDAWLLVIAWLLTAFRPTGPYPVLGVHGEQGSTKSTLCRMLRRLVDPNVADLRSEPRDERDLAIAARNGWVVALENLSYVRPWLSDALCRLATGGGFATRALYSDDEETLFAATRPIILNGIEELPTRPDLLDRALLVEVPRLAEEDRLAEAELWGRFDQERPGILGALLDAVSGALRQLPTTQLAKKPRMADLCLWVTAAEPALGWESGSFLRAYRENRNAASGLALEASSVGGPLSLFAENHPDGWLGTATELLAALTPVTTDAEQKRRSWPKNGRALSGALRRLAPDLASCGILVTFEREPNTGRRLVNISKSKQSCVTRVTSVTGENETAASGDANPESGDANGGADETCVTGFPDAGDAKHAGDAKIPISPNGHVPRVGDVAAAAADDWREIL